MRKTVATKKRIIAGLIEKSGDVKAACKFARVKSTNSYYNFMQTDPEFAQKIKEMNKRRHVEHLDSIRWSINALRRMEAFRVVSILWEMRKKDS